MSYRVQLSAAAERDLERIPRDALRRVDAKLSAMGREPRPHGVAKLRGREGTGWRVRVGDYRILYTIDDDARTVSVYRIAPRSSAYQG